MLDLPHEVSGWHGYLVGTSMDGSVLISGESGKALWIVDVDRPETAVSVRLRTSTSEGLVLDPTGARLASVYYGDRNGSSPNRVVAGPLPPDAGRDRDVTLPYVPNSGRTFRVLAWTDATHVSVVRGTGDRFSEASAIFDVDVGTGSATQRVRLPDHSYGSGLHLATDLLSAPTVDAPEPQRPLDPRLVTGVGGGTLLLALFLALKWVRRVRP